jgi:glucans biosynthesis protein
MHGGAKGSGAPPGNRNAVKHGFYTRRAMEERKMLSTLLRDCKELLGEIE